MSSQSGTLWAPRVLFGFFVFVFRSSLILETCGFVINGHEPTTLLKKKEEYGSCFE